MYRGLFSSVLASHWRREALRTSLWLVPAVLVVAAIGLFIGTLAADRAAYRGDFGLPGWVISGSADAAPQLTLGTFVATFVYAVLVLASIGTGSHGDFVPHISVTVALGLTVIDLAVLIYFIHHTAISIQLPQVIASIAADPAEAIREQGGGSDRAGPDNGPGTVELLSQTETSGAVRLAPVSGHVQFIKYQNLVPAGHPGRRRAQPGPPAWPLHRARAHSSRLP